MGILTCDQRLLRFLLSLSLQHLGSGIAEVVEGRVAGMAVIEGQTGGIELTHLVIHRLDVRSYAALVAQAPQDDTGVVEVALHQRLGTVHMGIAPGGIVPHLLVGIPISVTLLVGLVHHVEPPAVTEFVEVFAVGVVNTSPTHSTRFTPRW